MFYLRRLRYILRWLLFDGKWIIPLPTVILSIPLLVYFTSEFFNTNRLDVLKGAGLLLRLTGFVIIIWGVNSKLKKYTDGGIVGLFKKWWERRPWKTRTFTVSPATTTMSANPARVEYAGDTDQMSTEEKVDYLIDLFNHLKKRVDSSEESIRENKKELQSKINKLERQIRDRIEQLEDRVEVSFIGNVEKELFGAISIFLGVIYTSIPGTVLNITDQIIKFFL